MILQGIFPLSRALYIVVVKSIIASCGLIFSRYQNCWALNIFLFPIKFSSCLGIFIHTYVTFFTLTPH